MKTAADPQKIVHDIAESTHNRRRIGVEDVR
ncbi:hypothetical protein OKW41_006247 [Paraburkholderia sp. UCT70]